MNGRGCASRYPAVFLRRKAFMGVTLKCCRISGPISSSPRENMSPDFNLDHAWE